MAEEKRNEPAGRFEALRGIAGPGLSTDEIMEMTRGEGAFSITGPKLKAFGDDLFARLDDEFDRPFVCDGSPLNCTSFIVGFNAATRLPRPFSAYWSEKEGFLLERFKLDYLDTRPFRGNRPRIEAISAQLQPCLETNLYAKPTKKAAQLAAANKKESLVDFLFERIRPAVVYVHSNEPIRYFERATGASGFTEQPKAVTWQGHRFVLFGTPGPLFRMSIEGSKRVGTRLQEALQTFWLSTRT